VAFYAVGYLGQIFSCVLEEVRGGAMRFQGSVIFVLLVDEEAARFGFVAVHLVHGTAGFLAGMFGEFLEEFGNVGFVSNLCHPGDSQHHHLRALLTPAGKPGETF
jgi:hypothetical protein